MQVSRGVVIFDLDGTLVDSVGQIGKNLNNARLDFDYPELPRSFYNENVGLPVELLISDLVIPSHHSEVLIARFREYLISEIRLGKSKTFSRVCDLLQAFLDQNINLAIATSKPTHIANLVQKNSILNRYPFVIQGTDGFPPKPNPEVIRRVLLNFPHLPALMVGDRSEDILAASAAGINSIGIASGAHSMEKLLKSGASMVFPNISAFADELREDFSQILGFFK